MTLLVATVDAAVVTQCTPIMSISLVFLFFGNMAMDFWDMIATDGDDFETAEGTCDQVI